MNKVIILSGFLGSGKTTALMGFARHLVGISDPGRPNKVVILENEVGETGIDDQFLRGGGYTVSNLFDGCACCSVSGELVSGVIKIRNEMDPQWLVIETTGIAYPKAIQENLEIALNLHSRICVLVDASRWRRLRVPMDALLRGQIIGCDVVLLNKTDLVTQEELLEIESDIAQIDSSPPVLRISAIGDVLKSVWDAVTGDG